MTDFFLLVFVLAGSLLRWADAYPYANVVECEGLCSELVQFSCEDFLNQYDLHGSCCSLETHFSGSMFNWCRVQVGHGNCYWYPKCKKCNPRGSYNWRAHKCGVEYRGAEGYDCPASKYPTNWEEPPVYDGPWNAYSCSPTFSPRTFSEADTAGYPAVNPFLIVILLMAAPILVWGFVNLGEIAITRCRKARDQNRNTSADDPE